MLSYLEQVQHTQKSRCARQLGSDIRKSDGFDRVHLDRAILHAVTGTHRNTRIYPESDAARNLSAANSLAKPFGKHHSDSFASGSLSAASCRLAIPHKTQARSPDPIMEQIDTNHPCNAVLMVAGAHKRLC